MPRPPFAPDASQRRILAEIGRIAARRTADETRLSELVAEADAAGIPILVIAEKANIERKTVYKRLGRNPVNRTGEGDQE